MQNNPAMSPNPFEEMNQYHAALAQLHRWYQIYESSNPDVHFDIFAEDFTVDSAAGQVKGLEAYQRRLKDFQGWKNAHHVMKAALTKMTDEEIELKAEIIYQNIRPNGERFAYQIEYETVLVRRPGDLPLFKQIKLRPTATLSDTTFVDAYQDNRLRSFTHYWLYLMETAQGVAAPFKELLDQDYRLDLGRPGPVTTWNEFDAWVQSVPKWLAASAHTIVTGNSGPDPVDHALPGLMYAFWEFAWDGLSVKGEPMIAKTRHNWVLNSNLSGRFATMKDMKVQILVPFQVKT